jgi:EmrB/QacA subfamily drug resistance transporter
VTPTDDKLDRGTILALVAMAFGVLVIANDFTALSVAIPQIEKDLGTDLTTAQWVINGYALVFGVLIVTGGRLADLFGRKRIFMVGSAIFATFSVIGGFSPNVEMLIACRAVMGIGGAMMWPAVLGMTYAIVPDSRAGLAGGLILGVAGFGNAVGPMIGGLLTDELSWRWVFFINLPIALFAMFVTQREVTESQVEVSDRRLDYPGVATLTLGVVSLLLALDEGTDLGFASPTILALFGFAVVMLVAFAVVESRQGEHALVPRDVLKNRIFTAANVAVLLMSAIFFSALLYLPQFFTKVLGYSALESGAGLLPMMGVFAATSFIAGSLYERLGAKRIVSVGAAFLGAGMLILSFLDAGSSYLSLVPGMVVLGIGVGLFYSSITTSAVTALDPSRASLAGGIVYMCQIAGGAIGLGLNTAIVVSAGTSKSDLADGISNAFRVDAALAAVGLVVALLYVGGTVKHEERRVLRWHHRAHA